MTYTRHAPTTSEDDYNADPGVRSSLIKRLTKYAPGIARLNAPPTAPMIVGTMFHEVAPDFRLQGKYAVVEDGRTKAGKEAKAEALAQGIPVLSRGQADQIEAMAKATREHPWCAEMIEQGLRREESAFATLDGVDCKCRVDAVVSTPGGDIIIDWKTAQDASPEGFARAVSRFGYHVQQAHYENVWRKAVADVAGFYFVAVQNTAPYYVAVYELDRSWIAEGQAQWASAIDTYISCETSGAWPKYDDVQTLRPKGWDLKLTTPVADMRSLRG